MKWTRLWKQCVKDTIRVQTNEYSDSTRWKVSFCTCFSYLFICRGSITSHYCSGDREQNLYVRVDMISVSMIACYCLWTLYVWKNLYLDFGFVSVSEIAVSAFLPLCHTTSQNCGSWISVAFASFKITRMVFVTFMHDVQLQPFLDWP